MRIVLDTNVYISALLARGGPSGIVLALIKRHEHTLVTSPEQIEEIQRVVLRRRMRPLIPSQDAAEFIDYLESVAEVVTELRIAKVSADPDDDVILATAVAGRAEMIVSGDKKHMLSLGAVEGIPILSPRNALTALERE